MVYKYVLPKARFVGRQRYVQVCRVTLGLLLRRFVFAKCKAFNLFSATCDSQLSLKEEDLDFKLQTFAASTGVS